MATLQLDLGDDVVVFAEVAEEVRTREVADGRLEANFEKVSRSLRGVVKSLDAQIRTLDVRPTTFTLEMGAELKGEADLWIVSGETKGHIKITMTWDRSKGS